MNTNDSIAHAIELAHQGNHHKARQILRKAVKKDPANERAWLGLSYLATTYQEKRDCLHKVLEINPGNQKAVKKLAELQKSLDRDDITRQIEIMQKKSKAGIRYQRLMLVIAIVTILIIVLGFTSGLFAAGIENAGNLPFASFLSIDKKNITGESDENVQKKSSNLVLDQTSAVSNTVNLSFPTYSVVINLPTNIDAAKALPENTSTNTPTTQSSATPTPTITPTITTAPTETSTVTIQPSPTPTHIVTLTSSPTVIPSPTLPVKAEISNIEGKAQRLSLSCESRAAATWANYFGFNIEEIEFFSRLPVSDNPENGFVGDVNGDWGQIPPDPYGIHASPVAVILKEYGLNAEAVYNARWEDVQNEIASGRPVVVWVVGHVEPGKAVPYHAQDGSTVMVARYQHTVVLTGYDNEKEEVTILDGADTYTRSYNTFFQSWAVLGNMTVQISSKPAT